MTGLRQVLSKLAPGASMSASICLGFRRRTRMTTSIQSKTQGWWCPHAPQPTTGSKPAPRLPTANTSRKGNMLYSDCQLNVRALRVSCCCNECTPALASLKSYRLQDSPRHSGLEPLRSSADVLGTHPLFLYQNLDDLLSNLTSQ